MMNVSDIKKIYFDKFVIDMEKAEKKALLKNNENAIITAATEMCGDKYIKQEHLFDKLFPENIGYKKETRVKQQKAGCDYIIYMPNNEELYVDLKVCIGPNYNMVEDDYNDKNDYTEAIKDGIPKGVPIEVYQNNNFTFSKGKLTDYVLFIIMDSDGITYSLLDYDKVHKIALEHKKQWDTRGGSATLVNKGRMKWHRSNNGSGIYIKYQLNK